MPTVRTIFQPDTLQDVGEQEAAQLAAEGLLVDAKEWDGPAPTVPAGATVTASSAPAPATSTPATVASAVKEASTDGSK